MRPMAKGSAAAAEKQLTVAKPAGKNVFCAASSVSELLAEAPATKVDMFYPLEIVCERFIYGQRQYEVSWFSSVTTKHKSPHFKKNKIARIIKSTQDGTYALVDWRSTWEKADTMDGDSAQAELVSVWAEYCNANGIQTPLSPPGSEDEEPAEPIRAKRKNSESSEQQTQTKRRRDEDEEEKVVKKIEVPRTRSALTRGRGAAKCATLRGRGAARRLDNLS